MILKTKDRRRFMDSLGSSGDESCWVWEGTKNNSGYPLFSLQGEMVSALRLLYQIYYERKIPKNWVVSHICEDNSCVNPNHIYITTRSERTRQAYQKRELIPASQRGEKNPNSKLCEQDIRAIRAAKEDGITHQQLAKEYQVTKTTISQIVNNKLWAHVT
ncbi:MAG: HNH endonuclease [Candidatus Marinimicrobia bacterium]|nr:HNH endonuclease [Candidatus Neomarinimicrobiota bacterium]MCF7827904.1 HNH endonuclease [Candidatus Neomarinimicrobiota bacterium]MCF7879341.1 HNH endonuclease [Candidatus Neomarinimicrobiota bacterium]